MKILSAVVATLSLVLSGCVIAPAYPVEVEVEYPQGVVVGTGGYWYNGVWIHEEYRGWYRYHGRTYYREHGGRAYRGYHHQ